MTKFVYIASPYSSPLEEVRELRYQQVMLFVAWIIAHESKSVPFSPILHGHPMAKQHELPTDAAFWEHFNNTYLDRSDELYVLGVDGWDVSVGVRMERTRAKELGKPRWLYHPSINGFTRTELTD